MSEPKTAQQINSPQVGSVKIGRAGVCGTEKSMIDQNVMSMLDQIVRQQEEIGRLKSALQTAKEALEFIGCRTEHPPLTVADSALAAISALDEKGGER